MTVHAITPHHHEPSVADDQVKMEASSEFVNSDYVRDLTRRALSYLEVGYPIHLCGPAGTGKTTLAFHIAAQLGSPVTLIHGDDEFGSSDLVGKQAGIKRSKIVDNYIHTVVKTEEEVAATWQDNRLTTACRNGFTLIYDEFTRSRPEANNALLSVLEEKILNLPKLDRRTDSYMGVHPGFRAIFTSNPEEYVGVHKTQDALLDRMITIQLGHFNRATEVDIAMAKSGLARREAEKITEIIRSMRSFGGNNHRPTVRATIAVSKVTAHCGVPVSKSNLHFRQICRDVLGMDMAATTRDGQTTMDEALEQVFNSVLGRPKKVVSKSSAKSSK